MGQQDVYSFLRKHKITWFLSKEIARGLRASIGSVTTSLKRLRESKQVQFRIKKRESKKAGKRKVFEYKFKK
ncbi:MAG: hypothetical protein V1735_02890 [Nanoarchaeota archaeon]|jgi:hypothetical protein